MLPLPVGQNSVIPDINCRLPYTHIGLVEEATVGGPHVSLSVQ